MNFQSRPGFRHNKNMGRSSHSRHNCYCAFCKTPRRIYKKRSISFVNLIASAMTALVFMLAMWHSFDPRVIVVFVVCLGISEVFVKIRWRLSIVCKQCGFDPVLYLKAPDAAAQKVKFQLDKRKEDPQYLLAKPLNLPAIPAEKAKALESKSKGKLVSRSI